MFICDNLLCRFVLIYIWKERFFCVAEQPVTTRWMTQVERIMLWSQRFDRCRSILSLWAEVKWYLLIMYLEIGRCEVSKGFVGK